MARVDVDQITALQAVRSLLRAAFSELDETNVFITLYPEAPYPIPSGEHFVSIAPGAGSFDEGLQAGGGAAQCSENSEVLVTVYSRLVLDQAGREELLLTDPTEGLLTLKRRVLGCLVAADPLTTGGTPFVRDLLQPRRASAPEHDLENQIGWITIPFSLAFDWDLST